MKNTRQLSITVLCILVAILTRHSHAQPTTEEAKATLRKATLFYHKTVSTHGGYLWAYSADLKLREGEGVADKNTIWIQPPGTPSVGKAFLNAYAATGDKVHLDAATAAAHALLQGQLRSGGWDRKIVFDPDQRRKYAYRVDKQRRKQADQTLLDDDMTQAAIRFLIKYDKATHFKHKPIREAIAYALHKLLTAQFPNGAWYQWWKGNPTKRDLSKYPVKSASYPSRWPRVWPNTWTGRYFLNDDVVMDVIDTLLLAWQVYQKNRFLNAAKKAGDFLILAQMPDPQPAWAQQYDPNMNPVWDRKFEPPAITGLESQNVLTTLIKLYRWTGDKKYLKPIPDALTYLKKSQLKPGKLARFYELKTNRPLYFKRRGKIYTLTYNADDLPSHYGFIVNSKLPQIERRYLAVLNLPKSKLFPTPSKPKLTQSLTTAAQTAITQLTPQGAWIEKGQLKYNKTTPPSGIIQSTTFIKNTNILAQFIQASN